MSTPPCPPPIAARNPLLGHFPRWPNGHDFHLRLGRQWSKVTLVATSLLTRLAARLTARLAAGLVTCVATTSLGSSSGGSLSSSGGGGGSSVRKIRALLEWVPRDMIDRSKIRVIFIHNDAVISRWSGIRLCYISNSVSACSSPLILAVEQKESAEKKQ